MLTISTLIFVVYFIIQPVHGQVKSGAEYEACHKQTSYSLSNLSSLDIAMYYDVDKEALDFTFVKSVCKARETISHVNFELYPGVSTKLNKKNEIECYHADKNNKDCTDSIAAACASKLVDYSCFVCCTADGKSAADCVTTQNSDKVEEYNQCTQLQHPTIKPNKILLDNANAGKAVYPPFNAFPIVTFNGNIDPCARIRFAEDPVGLICAMLAKNTDEGCKKEN